MRQCHAIGCERKTRNREHHFCSTCWFNVPAILKRRYYWARGRGDQRLIDKAISDVTRSLARREPC